MTPVLHVNCFKHSLPCHFLLNDVYFAVVSEVLAMWNRVSWMNDMFITYVTQPPLVLKHLPEVDESCSEDFSDQVIG